MSHFDPTIGLQTTKQVSFQYSGCGFIYLPNHVLKWPIYLFFVHFSYKLW